jgi:hypothetical protein
MPKLLVNYKRLMIINGKLFKKKKPKKERMDLLAKMQMKTLSDQ